MSLWRGLAGMSLYSVYKTVIRRVFRHSWINWSEACVRHLHMAGAVYMTEKVPYEKLFKEADSVLYEVKTRGKNSFEIRKI